MDADVCVIGAGFAGLSAAHLLEQQGCSVVLLEARDRVGGRTWCHRLDGDVPVDRGGAWLAASHDAAQSLVHELGASTYKTYVQGAHLLAPDGERRRYHGLIPKIGARAVLGIAREQWRINRMARRVDVDAPWGGAEAEAWDAQSVAEWLEDHPVPTTIGNDLFEMAVRGLFAATDLHDVSLLHLNFLVRAHGSIEHLFSIKGGAQEQLVVGGLGGLAERLAATIDGPVHLNAPVRAIRQSGDGVTVTAHGLEARARRAVVAIPPALVCDVAFDPPLAADRRALYQRAVGGSETKTLVVYDTPFWRAEGFSGQSAGAGSVTEVTIDASPSDGSRGVLASFTFGRVAERVDALDAAERKGRLVDELVRRFGPGAGSPIDVIETPWWSEPWSKGCSFAHLPPGALTRYGHLLRAPEGRVHWAGTETATVSHGAVDGAIRSGQRAAAEVLSSMAQAGATS